MRLRKMPIAEQDLLGIWAYIAHDSPVAADRFWQRLDERFQLLLTRTIECTRRLRRTSLDMSQ